MFTALGRMMMHIFSNRKNVYSSKWGYYPCNYEVYKKLKRLRALYFLAARQHRAWERWSNRLPKNKFITKSVYDEKGRRTGFKKMAPIPEPIVCPVFSIKRLAKQYFDEMGYHKEGIDVRTLILDDLGVLADYERARKPVSNFEKIQHLELTTDQIDSMLKDAEAWHASYCS